MTLVPKFPALFMALAICILSSGCSSGGDGGAGGLQLVSTTLIPGAVIPINAPIEWTFNKPLLLASANLSSVSLRPLSPVAVGAPMAGPVGGSFFLKLGSNDRTLVFQPACSQEPNAGSGALVAGNGFGAVFYDVTIFGGPSANAVLLAQDGTTLAQSVTITVQTPVYPPQWPYWDSNPFGSPQVIEKENLPGALGMNLAIAPNPPLIFILDQAVLPSSIDDGSLRAEFSHPSTGQTIVIPAKTSLSENCNAQGRAALQMILFGVLPPDADLRFFLSKNVSGYGLNDHGAQDVLVHTARIAAKQSSPQPDAFFEGFDTTEQWDPSPPLIEAPAIWKDGRLDAAGVSPGAGTSDVEIGPGTSNGTAVVFSTDGSLLYDTQGKSLFFPGGVIDVRDFTLKAPVPGGKSRLLGIGSKPLIIRCSGNFTIEAGAGLRVDGGDALDVSGLMVANQPQPGGEGACSGGNGGSGSPSTTQSDTKGEDGFGPFQSPNGGGAGGHSAYGVGSNNNVMPGGGGGGNWGVLERDPSQNWAWVAFCYSKQACSIPGCPLPPLGCPDTQCDGVNLNPSTRGEAGNSGNQCISSSTTPLCTLGPVNGNVCQLDAVDSQCLAKGGAAGPAVFRDADPRNDFLGRKPLLQGGNLSVLEGEGALKQCQGGQGGGGSGDAVPNKNFPSGANFAQTDLRGGAGGGGGGAISIQALGRITIFGEISANGGSGGMGESDTVGSPGGGGGGGGSAGMIVLEAGELCRFGNFASIHATGGNRGKGGFTIPLQPAGSGGQCRQSVTAGRGGAGGKGIILIHAPFVASSPVACANETQPSILPGAILVDLANGASQAVLCETDSLLTKIANPSPHVLTPTFGARSSALSKWFYAGQAWASSPPSYEFAGLDPNGFVTGGQGTLLAAGSSGAGAAVLSANAVAIESAALVQSLGGEPRLLLGDGFLPASGKALLPIVNATISGYTLRLDTDPLAGPIPALGDWQLRRLHVRTLMNGIAGPLPSLYSAQILFEGAQETSPGSMSPDLASIVGPTADPAALNGSVLWRFRVFFDCNPNGVPVSPSLPIPGFDFLKLHYSF